MPATFTPPGQSRRRAPAAATPGAGAAQGGWYGKLQGATTAAADGARQDFQTDVGGMLGNLNAIGGLRSGGVTAGVNNLTTNFARQVGNSAASTAVAAGQLESADMDRASADSRAGAELGFRNRELDVNSTLSRDRFTAEGVRDTRNFNYQASRDQSEDTYRRGRDTVGDTRYADERDYGRGQDRQQFEYRSGRDAISDTRYGEERDYGRGRDRVADERYGEERTYSRGRDEVADARDTRNFEYGRNRDQIGDSRYTDETVYSRNRDQVGDTRYNNERDYSRGRDQVDDQRYQQERGDARAAGNADRAAGMFGSAGQMVGGWLGSRGRTAAATAGAAGVGGGGAGAGGAAAAGGAGGLGTAATLGIAGAGIGLAMASDAAVRRRIDSSRTGTNNNYVASVQRAIDSGRLTPAQLETARAAIAHHGGGRRAGE